MKMPVTFEPLSGDSLDGLDRPEFGLTRSPEMDRLDRHYAIMHQQPAEACSNGPVIVRRQRADDYEAIRQIYAAAFRRSENPEAVPLEVGIFQALWEVGDLIPELSFTALEEVEAVGHVTASRATVAADSVVAVGPIGVLPEHQGRGIGSALMEALLTAADTAHVPMVVLLGSPQYYARFGFRSAQGLGVIPPEPTWGEAFQARPLTAYTPAVGGRFQYAPAFSS